MGKPMAKNLLAAGYPLVVHDRVEAPVKVLVAAGAREGRWPKDVAAQVDVLITMLPNSPDVKDVVLGENGVLAGARGGLILVDMSSIAPLVSKELANQIIVALNIAAMSEAMVLAQKAGVDPEKVYQAIRGGLAGSTVLDAKMPLVLAGNFKPGFRIELHIKDLMNALDTAHAVGAPAMLTAAVCEAMQLLRAGGHGADDHGGLVQFFEKLAGVAGANYGYALMWIVVIALLMRFLFVSLIAKYQLCNERGEGVLDGLTRLHPWYAPFLALTAVVLGHIYGSYMLAGLGASAARWPGWPCSSACAYWRTT